MQIKIKNAIWFLDFQVINRCEDKICKNWQEFEKTDTIVTYWEGNSNATFLKSNLTELKVHLFFHVAISRTYHKGIEK
jgi:hypothetical protein